MRESIDVDFRVGSDFGGTVDGADIMRLGEVVPGNDSVLLAGKQERREEWEFTEQT